MQKKSGSLTYLEGIRGLAAFGVFLNHFALTFYYAFWKQQITFTHLQGREITYAKSYWSFLTAGGFDVAIFFVLSGFVLSRKFFRSGVPEDAASGLHRRFLRLYIPTAFSVLISFVLVISHAYYNVPVSAITQSDWFARLWRINFPGQRLISSLVYGVMFKGDASFNTVLWTISTEFYGSLFVFAFLLFTSFTPRYRLPMMLIALYYFYITDGIPYMAFVLGMTLCYTERWLEQRKHVFFTIAGAFLLIAGLLFGSHPFANPEPQNWQFLFKGKWDYTPWSFTLGAYLLTLAFICAPLLQKIVSIRPFRFLGYISFSLYLLHPLLLGSFGSWLFLKVYRGPASYNTSVLIVFGATLAVLLPLSWLMTKYVDQFGIRTAQRVYEYLRRRPAAKVTEAQP